MTSRQELNAWTLRETGHFHGTGIFGYTHQCVEQPRLQRRDTYRRKDRSVETVWLVDGAPVADLDAAPTLLDQPPTLTADERAALEVVPTHFAPVRQVRELLRAILLDAVELMMKLNDKGALEYSQEKAGDGGIVRLVRRRA